jgi:glycine/D-amino acid oxidase-like deaminating enzyme
MNRRLLGLLTAVTVVVCAGPWSPQAARVTGILWSKVIFS